MPTLLTSPEHCAKSSGKSLILSRVRLHTFDPDMAAVQALTEVLGVFKSTDEHDKPMTQTFVKRTSKRIKHLNQKKKTHQPADEASL